MKYFEANRGRNTKEFNAYMEKGIIAKYGGKRYTSDGNTCKYCIYLGQFINYDLYFHYHPKMRTHEATTICVYGNEPGNYRSGLCFIYPITKYNLSESILKSEGDNLDAFVLKQNLENPHYECYRRAVMFIELKNKLKLLAHNHFFKDN